VGAACRDPPSQDWRDDWRRLQQSSPVEPGTQWESLVVDGTPEGPRERTITTTLREIRAEGLMGAFEDAQQGEEQVLYGDGYFHHRPNWPSQGAPPGRSLFEYPRLGPLTTLSTPAGTFQCARTYSGGHLAGEAGGDPSPVTSGVRHTASCRGSRSERQPPGGAGLPGP
jgi:hypothetical protein